MNLSERLRRAALHRATVAEPMGDGQVADVEGVYDLDRLGRTTPTIDLTGGTAQLDLTLPAPHLADLPTSEESASSLPPPPGTAAGPESAPDHAPTPDEDPEGDPTVCSSCGILGHRDLRDPFTKVDYYSCTSCFRMWQVRED